MAIFTVTLLVKQVSNLDFKIGLNGGCSCLRWDLTQSNIIRKSPMVPFLSWGSSRVHSWVKQPLKQKKKRQNGTCGTIEKKSAVRDIANFYSTILSFFLIEYFQMWLVSYCTLKMVTFLFQYFYSSTSQDILFPIFYSSTIRFGDFQLVSSPKSSHPPAIHPPCHRAGPQDVVRLDKSAIMLVLASVRLG